MKNFILLLIILFSFTINVNCSNRDDDKNITEQEYIYKGIYKGNFISEDNKILGTFNFYVIRKDDIYSNKFDIDFNYFIVNPSGIKFKNSSIDENGNFITSVYSFDNFNREQFRGQLKGKILNSLITGTFELSRNSSDPNSTTITKGTFLGNKEQ